MLILLQIHRILHVPFVSCFVTDQIREDLFVVQEFSVILVERAVVLTYIKIGLRLNVDDRLN